VTVRTVVVALDGSPGSALACRWAADLATLVDARVVAVHACGLLEAIVEQPGVDPHERLRRRMEDEWCSPLAASGARWRPLVRDGDPVGVVLAVADEEDADIVVVGSRGLGGFPEQLLGSTSTQVAQRSTRPVVIVPGPKPVR
jgi:nucleotide-binding universal stress UspA family protein